MTKIGSSSFFNNFETEKKITSNKNPLEINQIKNDVASSLSTSSSFVVSPSLGKALPSLLMNNSPSYIEYTVRKGDSLSDIAKEFLGNKNKYMDIFEANKDSLRNPNDLRVGMTIRIPNDNNPHIINKPNIDFKFPDNQEYQEITVKRGQSLSVLALKYLGDSNKYMDIFSANKDILSSPDAVKPGMKLKIPVEISNKPKIDIPAVSDIQNDIDVSGMTTGAKELYNAINKYQDYHNNLGNTNRTLTNDAQKKEIAVELDKAGKAFDVDPKIMLSVYAHESGGFDPKAKSYTGAGGLGQLTGVAIRQVQYMAGMAKGQKGEAPYTNYKENFITNTTSINQRFNIKKNIWTSTAYMSYEIKDRNNGNIKRSLERYGDPNVKTYENKVNNEYKILFGGKIF